MKALFTADLHLTLRKQDEYRWEIFEWLGLRIRERAIDYLFLLGDLTDQKDRHSAELVNRIVGELRQLSDLCHIVALAGNHDYVKPDCPFFKFIDGRNIEFIYEQHKTQLEDGTTVAYIPHSVRIDDFFPVPEADFVLLHHTFDGAMVASGHEMKTPAKPNKFADAGWAISGDVHVPQEVGPVIYCGAPYPITFGDSYKPRVLFFDGKELKSMPRATIKKVHVKVKDADDLYSDELDLQPDDQVRVTIVLPKSEFGDWPDHKERIIDACSQLGVQLFGVELQERIKRMRLKESEKHQEKIAQARSPEEIFELFCKAHESIDRKLADAGRRLVS